MTTSRIPNVAKVGGLQSQGVKGKIVVGYIDPLTTQDLKSSGFPRIFRVNNLAESTSSPEFTIGDIQKIVPSILYYK
jgi:hypothetical protein